MFTTLVVIPVVLLLIAFLLGAARLYRTLIFLMTWLVLCSTLYIASAIWGVTHLNPAGLMGMVIAMLLALPSVWFATLFSFATSKQVSPAPVEVVYDAYQALDDEKKEKVHRLARIGVAFAAKHGATYLRNKGYAASADALTDVSKMI